MKKCLLFPLVILFITGISKAQTNPSAQSLPYTQNFGTTSFSSLPSGIAAWTVNGSPIGTQSSAESSTNNGNASITSATTAQATGGVYGYATSSNGRLYIQSSSNNSNGTSQLATAINTTGQSGVTVSYDIEMISVTARTMGVELQYRIGTSGSWTAVSGSVYSHNSSDKSNGAIDHFTSLALPLAVNNNSVVQLRWVTWRGSESGNSSGIAIDNIAIAGVNQQTWYFRSNQSGNWNQSSTWQSSNDNTNWAATYASPDHTSNTITIQSSHTVTATASVTFDQTVVNGKLVYGDNTGSTITINDGSGIDLTINGSYEDIGPNSNTWSGSSTWSIGSSGTLLRTRGTSANNWKEHYEGGIATIPSTANWIIRKTGSDNPSITSTGSMYYPNLIIENTTGSSWNSIGFSGSSSAPVIKGNFNIGGSGTNAVIFVNSNTNSNLIAVNGDLIVKTGSGLQNDGTGFTLLSNINNQGTYTGSVKNLSFTGAGNQTVSGLSTAFSDISTLTVNKSSGIVTLSTPVIIKNTLVLTKGKIKTTTTNYIGFADNAVYTGGSNDAYVYGPILKTGNDAFTFPLGDTSITLPYHPLSISAPSVITDSYIASYFATGQTSGSAMDTLTIDSLNSCEYWTLARNAGTSAVKVGVNWNTGRCKMTTDLTNMRLAYWNGTKWVKVGDVIVSTTVTSNNNLSSFGSFTLAQDPCPIRRTKYPLTITGPSNPCIGGATVNLVAATSPVYTAATYSWTAPTSVSGNTYSVTPITSTETYVAQVQYFSGCTSTKSYTLNANPAPEINAGPDVIVCSSGSAVLSASTDQSLNYLWSPSTGLSCSNCINPQVTPSANTVEYIVTATDQFGCLSRDTVVVSKLSGDNHKISFADFNEVLGQTGRYKFEYNGTDHVGIIDNEPGFCVSPIYPQGVTVRLSLVYSKTLVFEYEIMPNGSINGLRRNENGHLSPIDPAFYTFGNYTLHLNPAYIQQLADPRPSAKLKKELDASCWEVPSGGKLYFVYEEEYNSGALDIKIYDSKRRLVNPVDISFENISTGTNAKTPGMNSYSVSFDSGVSGMLYLEVKTSKGENYYLRFKLL